MQHTWVNNALKAAGKSLAKLNKPVSPCQDYGCSQVLQSVELICSLVSVQNTPGHGNMSQIWYKP